jgi:hypothetical protein
MKKYGMNIFLLFVALFVMYISSRRADTYRIEVEKYKNSLDSLQNIKDSIDYELFPSQIEIGRYQVAFRIFMERNPEAAKQYATIISEETE